MPGGSGASNVSNNESISKLPVQPMATAEITFAIGGEIVNSDPSASKLAHFIRLFNLMVVSLPSQAALALSR